MRENMMRLAIVWFTLSFGWASSLLWFMSLDGEVWFPRPGASAPLWRRRWVFPPLQASTRRCWPLSKSITPCRSILLHQCLGRRRNKSEKETREDCLLPSISAALWLPSFRMCERIGSQAPDSFLISWYHCAPGITACRSGSLMSSSTSRPTSTPRRWRSTTMNGSKISPSTSPWRTRYTKTAFSLTIGRRGPPAVTTEKNQEMFVQQGGPGSPVILSSSPFPGSSTWSWSLWPS